MKNRCHLLLLALALLTSTTPVADAYSIHSGLTEGCHEKITQSAFLAVLPQLNPHASIVLPTSEIWRKFADGMIRANRIKESFPEFENESFQLTLISILVGVRSPDTEGHATTNLARLRQIHGDPDPAGQYAHALRGVHDDGPEGDAVAIEGLRQSIIGLIGQTLESLRRPPAKQLISAPLYLDFYGVVDIEVWEPAYHIGRALHALQDSFAHTIRSDDLLRIRHVLNYVDAIEGGLEEARDGLPHSVKMDSCEGESLPIAMTAGTASADLVGAINESVASRNLDSVKQILSQWTSHEPGCTADNDYCDSAWVALARQEPTGPYFEDIVGCSSMVSEGRSHGGWAVFALGLLFLFRGRRASIWFLGACLLYGAPVRAQGFMRMETHVSLLSDAPDRSLIASTFGWGLRGGYGFGPWRVLAHLERNYWLSTELSDRVTAGVLNTGLGAEYASAQDFVRTSAVIGTSTLRFDTLLDTRGTTGLFFELRPIELCWRPREWLGITLTPLSFSYVSPVLDEPPIRMVLYRTILGLEGMF